MASCAKLLSMPTPTTIDIAAGGLVESDDGGEIKIAVIYRPRHDDWSLPKGHVDAGESLEEAALREVLEETGCTAEISEIVPPVSYLVNGQPKIVVYYRMKLIEQGELVPNEEVSDVEWLSPAEAKDRFAYDSERNLLTAVYGV